MVVTETWIAIELSATLWLSWSDGRRPWRASAKTGRERDAGRRTARAQGRGGVNYGGRETAVFRHLRAIVKEKRAAYGVPWGVDHRGEEDGMTNEEAQPAGKDMITRRDETVKIATEWGMEVTMRHRGTYVLRRSISSDLRNDYSNIDRSNG